MVYLEVALWVGYVQVFSFTGGRVCCSLKAAGLLRGSV